MTRTKVVHCNVCNGHKEIILIPKKRKTLKKSINDLINQRDLGSLVIERPKMQERFDYWMADCTKRMSVYPQTEPKTCQKILDHHFRHHALHEKGEPEKKKKERIKYRCAKCPDPYRGWIRDASDKHEYEPTEVSIPVAQFRYNHENYKTSSTKVQSFKNSQIREKIRLAYMMEDGFSRVPIIDSHDFVDVFFF